MNTGFKCALAMVGCLVGLLIGKWVFHLELAVEVCLALSWTIFIYHSVWMIRTHGRG